MSTTAPVTAHTSPQPQGHGRRFPLAWLRGVAALVVVTFHAYQHNRSGSTGAWPLSGGAHRAMLGTDLFVDMFFVLSGFVLWLPIARSALAGTTGRPGWVVLFRRTARLIPLYFTVVLVVWAVTNPSLPGHWQDLLLHLTFTHVYSDQYIFWTDGPAWSLAVEFHFYLLIALTIPLVHAATRRVGSPAGRMAVAMGVPAVCAVAGLAYLAWQIVLVDAPATNWSVWFNPLAKAPDFAVGMTLAVISAAGVRLGATARGALGVVGVVGLGALAMSRPFEGALTNWWHPAFALAIAVGLSAIVLQDGPYARWMSWRPLAWVGGLGYGIYLIHEPVLRLLDHLGVVPAPRPGLAFLVTAAMTGVVSTLLAWLSSRTVESAGLKTLGLIDDSGRSRDYYAHVGRHQNDSFGVHAPPAHVT